MPLRHGTFATGIAARVAAACALLSAAASPALAAQAEARAVALAANCRPGKITPVRQVVGWAGETVYKVDCASPKGAFVLIQCRDRQCVVLR